MLQAASELARSLGKPLLIEEYGIQPFTDPNGTNNTRDSVYQRITDIVVNDLNQKGPIAGGLVWQLVDDDFPGGDGFELNDIWVGQQSTANIIRNAASMFDKP